MSSTGVEGGGRRFAPLVGVPKGVGGGVAWGVGKALRTASLRSPLGEEKFLEMKRQREREREFPNTSIKETIFESDKTQRERESFKTPQ